MKKIAILGFGVVGGGIAEVLRENAAQIERIVGDTVEIKYILDKRDFPDSPYRNCVVKDIDVICADPEVALVAETIGGAHPAFEFSMKALAAGKHVVTSNKELVAKHGLELCAEAQLRGVSYLFEASVGGGIPVIRSLRTSLSADKIDRIDGIMNGTTNYIVTKMRSGADFDEVLKEAKVLGYAEANPTADVDGIDTQRKIMILTALVSGIIPDEADVYAETMTKVTPADMDAASRFGGTVKLIGSMRRNGGKVSAFVCPRFVRLSSPLAHIDDVYNGIMVESCLCGDVMYYGRGAGRYPTAGAVIADVTAALNGAAMTEKKEEWRHGDADTVVPFSEQEFSYYVRINASSAVETLEKAKLVAGKVKLLEGSPSGTVEIITENMREEHMQKLLEAESFGGKAESCIRLL